MDFARKQLEKYGWCEGKGLGKNENGISKALKPKLKRNITGVGHDVGADFTDHWWTDLYNKAATNIQVKEKNGKTKKITVDSSEFVITNSMWLLNKKKRNSVDVGEKGYGDYFIKTAVLNNDGSKIMKIKDSESENEEEKKDVFKMTDEELFAACEGRTIHKGARHGLNASGKLARIEQQEKLLLTQPKYKGYSHTKMYRPNKSKTDSEGNNLEVIDHKEKDTQSNLRNSKKKKKEICNSIIEDQKLLVENPEIKDDLSIEKIGFDGWEVIDNINMDNANHNKIKKNKSKRKKCAKLNIDAEINDLLFENAEECTKLMIENSCVETSKGRKKKKKDKKLIISINKSNMKVNTINKHSEVESMTSAIKIKKKLRK